jgi:hypothetical protein
MFFIQTAAWMEVEEHRFLRHVETRWLQLLPVVDRVIEQTPSLLPFFQVAATRLTCPRASKIRDVLLDPITLCDLHYLHSALKSLNGFLMVLQTVRML